MPSENLLLSAHFIYLDCRTPRRKAFSSHEANATEARYMDYRTFKIDEPGIEKIDIQPTSSPT